MSAAKQPHSESATKPHAPARSTSETVLVSPIARLGNANVVRLLQAKLAVSHPEDPYELEADRIADQVMRTPDSSMPVALRAKPELQRRCEACEEELQRSHDPSAIPTVDTATERSIASLATRGSALPPSVRSFMEPRFKVDFSAVRVHNDAQAHELARAVSAKAFTVGRDVVFGAGHYAPESEAGRRLIAHELTHVVQQGGAAKAVQRDAEIPNEVRTSSDATWYVEIESGSSVVEWGKDVTFRLRNTRIDKYRTLIGAPRNEPRFLLPDSGIVLTDDAGNQVLGKRSHRNLVYEAKPPRPGRYRATVFGHPREIKGMNPSPDDPEGAEVRVSVEFNVVSDLSAQNTNAPRVREVAERDRKRLEAADATDGEIAALFQRLAIGRAFEVLEENRQEAQAQLAMYTEGVNGKTGGQLIEELKPVLDYDLALKRTGYLLLHDHDFLERQMLRAFPEIDVGNRAEVMHSAVAFQKGELEKIDLQRTALVDAFPALALINRDFEAQFYFKKGPAERRDALLERIRMVFTYIETARHDLASGELSILDVQPILVETRQQLGIDNDPRKSRVINKLLSEHQENEKALGGLLTLAQLALLFVPGLGPFLAAGVGVINARQSWARYRRLRAAAGAGVREGIVDASEAGAAAFWAVLDSVFVVVDGAGAAAHALSAARRVAPHVQHAAARAAEKVDRAASAASRRGEGVVERLSSRPSQAVREGEQSAKARPTDKPRAAGHEKTDTRHPEFSGGKADARFVVSESELHQLVVDMFKRPVKPLAGEAHFYETMAEYDRVFEANWPGYRKPKGVAYRDPRTGHIHLSPQAGESSVIHEMVHKVSRDLFPYGRELFGVFLDEGITEAIVRARLGARAGGAGRYAENVAFVEMLQSRLGADVVENAVLHGDYRSLRDAIKQVFGGSERRTFEFLNKLRVVDAGKVRNPKLLEEVKALWEEAAGQSTSHGAMTATQAGGRKTATHGVATPESSVSSVGEVGGNERTIFDRGGKRPAEVASPRMARPFSLEGSRSPERLFEMLEKGTDQSLRKSVPRGRPVGRVDSGIFRRRMRKPLEAYAAYNEALARAEGREVAVWYNSRTGEYAVNVDTEVKVAAPSNDPDWIALVHHHPNPHNARAFRLPAPISDFSSLWDRLKNENRVVREFVEWDIPGGGRGRTEYGIDLSQREGPLYIRMTHPDGKVELRYFKSDQDYLKYYNDGTRYIEKNSAQHDYALGKSEPPKPNDRTAMPPTKRGGGQPPTLDPHDAALLDNVVAEARAETARGDGSAYYDTKLGKEVRVDPAQAHLVPECMNAMCGYGRKLVAGELKKAGVSESKIFLNQARDITGVGKHTFTVVEIAPGRHILVDTTFAQFTGELHGVPRFGERALARSGPIGAYLRNQLLQRGYIELADKRIINLYLSIVSEKRLWRKFDIGDLTRDAANWAKNPGLETY